MVEMKNLGGILLAVALLSASSLFAEHSVTMFVALTGKPTETEIVRKLDNLQNAGVDSFLFYPTAGMRLEYLGEEFWHVAETFAREAERRGMKMWLYDEYNWPSGSCRGRVPAEDERFRLTEFTLTRDATGAFVWGKAYGPRGWVNLLEPQAVQRFIELTHLEYERRLKRWIQNGTIVGIFTDEPGHPTEVKLPVGVIAHARRYEGLEEDYAAATGRDFRRDIEAWAAGERTNGVWSAYAKVYGQRFRASYYDQIRAVTDRLGIKFCGHLIFDDDPALAVGYNGDPLKVLSGESLPGIDEVLSEDRPEKIPFFLYALADYVTRTGGKGGMCEHFACGPADMPLDRLRRMLALSAFHGITRYFTVMSVMDASWLDKMRSGFSVTVGEFQPWFKAFPAIVREADRLSALAAKRPVYDVAVRMPQTLLARIHDEPARAGRVKNALNDVLKEVELSGLTPMLIAEDEASKLKLVIGIDEEGIYDERTAARFGSGGEVVAALRAQVRDGLSRRRNVLLRRYSDGTREELDLNPPPPPIPALALAVEGEWDLRLDRPTCYRVPFSTARKAQINLAEPLTVKLVARHHLPVPKEEDDDRIEGAPMCVADSPDGPPPYAFALDNQAVETPAGTAALPEGYRQLYRESAAMALAAGTHTLDITSGRNDELHFLPNLFVVGDFVETEQGLKPRPKRVGPSSLAAAGLKSFAGEATYSRQLKVPDGAVKLVADTGMAMARLKLGGEDLGVRLWPPFEWTIPAHLRSREVTAEITVVTSVLPIFGSPLAGQGLNEWLPRSDAFSDPGLKAVAFVVAEAEDMYEIVNVGSTTALHAFRWEATALKGLNLARRSQSGAADFQLLKANEGRIRQGATVILPLCPLTAILAPDFANPALKVDEAALSRRVASDSEERDAAANFVDIASTLFGMADFAAPLAGEFADRRERNLALYREMIDWCEKRGFRPVLVMPPLSAGFDEVMTEAFREIYVDGFVRDLKRPAVRFLDCSADKSLRFCGRFADGFVLNAEGAAAWTQALIKEQQGQQL